MKLFQEDDLKNIGKLLVAKNQTVAVAESVTSGLLQFALALLKTLRSFFMVELRLTTLVKSISTWQ
jgi:nicotinamide mononucleotide (NMN) deamidase PncC